jgi:hypothetical protein
MEVHYNMVKIIINQDGNKINTQEIQTVFPSTEHFDKSPEYQEELYQQSMAARMLGERWGGYRTPAKEVRDE